MKSIKVIRARILLAVGQLARRDTDLSRSVSRSGSTSGQWEGRRAYLRWGVCLALLLAPTLYIQTIGYDFVWDDFILVVQNQYFKQARYIPLYFSSDFSRLTTGALDAVYYRPLFALSFLLDFRVWGNNPAGYHLTNVLLYALVVWLVLGVSRYLFADARVAIAAAVLYALHPAHVEAVAFVSGRPDVLAALGILLAVLAYHRFRRGMGAWRWLAFTGSLLGFVLGLLAKEMAISLPANLVWYEIVLQAGEVRPDGKVVWSRVCYVLPHLMIGLGFLWFRWSAVQAVAPAGLGPGVLWHRLPGALEVLARYTVLAVWPFRMQPAYIQERPDTFLEFWPLLGLAIGVVSVLVLVAWRRIWPEGAFALGWFLIALVPVADLVPLAPRAVNMADRYLFIPSLGICWLLGLGGVHLWDQSVARSRRAALAFGSVVGGILLAWTGSTLAYLTVWQNNVTLFDWTVRQLPRSAFAYNNLGLALVRAGRIEEAIRSLETAVRLDPADVRSQLSLARTYVEHGRNVEGFRILDRLESRVGHEKVYLLVRARAHMAVEDWDAAYQVLSRALQRFPELAEGYMSLGFVLERQGRARDAMDAYRRAIEFRPDLAWAHVGLARIHLQLGEPGESASAARAALAIAPDQPEAARILAEAQARLRDVQAVPRSRQP